MKNKVKSVAMHEVRNTLPKIRRQVQIGGATIFPTYHNGVVGVFISVPASKSLSIQVSEEVPITKFRESATEYWERLQAEVECIYLTSHSRKVMAFVSTKFIPDLKIELPTIKILDCGLCD